MNKSITLEEIRSPKNYCVWGGYLETPVSFEPLGNQWLFNIEGKFSDRKLKKAIDEFEFDLCEILEGNGWKVVEVIKA